jgi:S1-C subfamily serine protease
MLGSDCTLVGGDSGGPLFDLDGKLIGIHSSIGGDLSENRHVPMTAYTQNWDDLVGGKLWGSQRVMMGLEDPNRPAMGVRLDQEFEDGVRVGGLSDPSPAAEAGIEVGDIIRRIGKKKVWDFEDMKAEMANLKAGEKVTVGVERGRERLEFEVKLGRLGKLWELDRNPHRFLEPEPAPKPEPARGRAALGVLLVRDAIGAQVDGVSEGSPAAKAGIRAGDVLLEIDGEKIGSASELAENILARQVGDRVKLRLRRGEEKKELEVTLGEAG